jgi:hydrogenase expression/formation protein HypD
VRYVDEYRDPALAESLLRRIREAADRPVTLMEVCGSHTVAIHRSGIKRLLPPAVRLVSGPGCPVCVTSQADVDRSLSLAARPDVIFTTFGDMIRVPGTVRSLQEVKAQGGDVRVVYSPADSLDVARQNPGRNVVFFAAGFETTVPTVAATLLRAAREGLANFKVFSVHKLIPPAMRALLSMEDVRIDGFLSPGHVSVVIGADAYQFIPREFGKPAVIAGFEPVDVLQGILLLVEQLREGRAEVEIGYARTVTREGSPKARETADRVFRVEDSWWRGLGLIPGSGLGLRKEWRAHDARTLVEGEFRDDAGDLPGCSCGAVLKGQIEPEECPLFGGACTPLTPVGPCMVSSEGSCSAHYKYGQAG